jgi:nicotinamide-nucleotide amidase
MNPEEALRGWLLAKPKRTLAVAESLTCGQVQALVGAVPGASDYFLGGITAYTLEQKVRLLGVDRRHARAVDCVSARVAVEMARGACELFGADIGVATTGYAQANRAVGVKTPMAWWALCHRRRGGLITVVSGQLELPAGTGRVAAQQQVAREVVRALVAYLRGLRR